jgi:hypothetical protein
LCTLASLTLKFSFLRGLLDKKPFPRKQKKKEGGMNTINGIERE